MNRVFFYKLLILLLLFCPWGCGSKKGNQQTNKDKSPQEQDTEYYNRLSPEAKDYIARFNVIVKDIRDFPPRGKNINKYFYIYKNVEKLEDAKIFIFGEEHIDFASQLWTAGALNRLIRENDIALFEGGAARTPVAGNVTEKIVADMFSTREYERRKTDAQYHPDSKFKLMKAYLQLFINTKKFLALDILRLHLASGFYWDLHQSDTEEKRNESMAQTMEYYLKENSRVLVVAGAAHTPLYEFVHGIDALRRSPGHLNAFLARPGAKQDEITDAFYDYFTSIGNNQLKTKSIFDFIKDKDYAILIPKNLPLAQGLVFPKSPR